MVTQTLRISGEDYVLVKRAEFEQLRRRADVIDDVLMPALPPKLPNGNYRALKAGRVILAQKLIRRRWAAGLTQAELARRARIRPETLNRIEKAKVTADTVTVRRIVDALEKSERKSTTKRL